MQLAGEREMMFKILVKVEHGRMKAGIFTF